MAADSDAVLAHGAVQKIGEDLAELTYQQPDRPPVHENRPVSDHKAALQAAFEYLTTEPGAVMGHHGEIEGVGHRVVHGGENFQHSVLIDGGVLKQMEALADLAPLHVPQNLKGYYASRELLPQAKQVAIFDTAFHHTMPARAFLYGLPYIHYTRDKIRRYGFHGTSHRYVSYRFAQLQGKTRDAFRLITCHLGNGCSVCAIDRGQSVDTSMGLTPLEGLVMGTRPGDVDPGAILYLAEHAGLSLPEMDAMLNEHSGLSGISGLSNDMRNLETAAKEGNPRAELAIDVFCYHVKKYIGAYLAAMNGADALIFTGGIGENASHIRARICEQMDALGIALDPQKNNTADTAARDISSQSAKVQTWVIPTDEELLMARDTVRCILGIPILSPRGAPSLPEHLIY